MKDLTISSDKTIKQALKKLNSAGEKCLVIVDENQTLLGTLSGGDLRKAILKGASVNDLIEGYYYRHPTCFIDGEYTRDQAKKMFIKNKFDLIPIVDKKNRIIDILVWEKVFENGFEEKADRLDVPVVIMAGGKGTRLEPFTKILPKPLVPIHDKPVIEHIIEKFTAVGIGEFYLTVNYKSLIIKAYFEELHSEYRIHFVDEHEPLGTAGSLQYLDGKFKTPFFVTNCDIIINCDLASIYKFHIKNDYDITLLASAKEYVIPYGICKLNGDGHLDCIHEKPQYDFLVNVGLYIVNPELLELIPKNGEYHITHLIEDAQKLGKRVGVYPVDSDAWVDVGQWAEYRKAVERL
ncbi:MAG: NTP transferase domain-containing protein [Proteobacteria bacterium]|nr:NTP transferase domain-containing protein [Pseudomonadota bacterium]MBU1389486.1 NTP transferase domain-containing protein [Pseudomonadota bacterium]MBU1541306.1 NTP transferase domain-containing protein [Pseudomonadota bacterium]MBU2430709.1 NTP transferase domain-containing protein [Pseudomonadota bacterium]MBU2480836.1 NTP transferase domain-containing protein [Pseudomonadota bacterium]